MHTSHAKPSQWRIRSPENAGSDSDAVSTTDSVEFGQDVYRDGNDDTDVRTVRTVADISSQRIHWGGGGGGTLPEKVRGCEASHQKSDPKFRGKF